MMHFYKIDIGGTELDALKGTKETICKNYPKLARCIYCQSTDMREIPYYILKGFFFI
jgi:hypothetical protein